jgi:uncharacterized protein with PIN domain
VRIAVDTNVLVRYLTWDDEGQAIEAADAIGEADAIVVPTIVLFELVWVLKRAYRYAGPEIINILRRLVAIREVETERPAAEAGIAMLARGGTSPMVSFGTRPTVPNAIASSHSTRDSLDCSVPTRSRFWELDLRREQSFKRPACRTRSLRYRDAPAIAARPVLSAVGYGHPKCGDARRI